MLKGSAALVSKIALRNIFRQRRRSLLTGLSMMGGYLLMSVSLGMSEGSYSLMINAFTENQVGHVQVHASGFLERSSLYRTIDDPQALMASLQQHAQVRAATQRVLGPGLAYGEQSSAPARIFGIDPRLEAQATKLEQKVKAGRYLRGERNKQGIWEAMLGAQIARILSLQVGSELILVSQGADGSIANDQYRVVGIVGTPDSMERMNVYLPLAAAQEFFSLGDRIHEIAILAERYSQARMLAADLQTRPEFANLDVQPWQEVERDFYRTMQADKAGNQVTLFIIVFMVALGVLNTVLMSVLERTREYGVIRAIGTRPGIVASTILLEMIYLALLSILVGIGLSVPINYWLMVAGIRMPEPIEIGGLYFERMVGEVSWLTIGAPVLVILLSVFLVSIWPALRAGRMQPIDALRDH